MNQSFLSKINIGKIITKHLQTLCNDNSGKVEFDDILTFVLIPLAGAACLAFYQIPLNPDATNIIITTLSILVGLLFNVIVIIFDIIKRDSTKRNKNKLLNELLTNISYSIVLSIIIIVVTLLTYIEIENVNKITTWVVYFLIGNYFLTVLMILKRMYILFTNELVEIERNNESEEK